MKRRSGAQARAFFVAAIVIPLALWPVAFNLGVWGEIFYRDIFRIWIISVAALLAQLFVRFDEVGNPWAKGFAVFCLLLPSLAMIVASPVVAVHPAIQLVTEVLVLILAMPYLAWLMIWVSNPEVLRLRDPGFLAGLIVISMLTLGLSVALGLFHNQVLYCHDFRVAGDHVPDGCLP